MQPWRPPPKPVKLKGLVRSSLLGSVKRSGSNCDERAKTCSSRCAKAGDVAAMCPCEPERTLTAEQSCTETHCSCVC